MSMERSTTLWRCPVHGAGVPHFDYQCAEGAGSDHGACGRVVEAVTLSVSVVPHICQPTNRMLRKQSELRAELEALLTPEALARIDELERAEQARILGIAAAGSVQEDQEGET